MMPIEADSNTFWEHVFRYEFACRHLANSQILDIASGEGYGTHALALKPNDVIGIDISQEAVSHAIKKYNLDFRVGNAESIPLPSNSMDAVVSYETIEHVPNPRDFINEVARVLKPGGKLFISTPNANTYLAGTDSNPFHCSELTLKEFLALLDSNFTLQSIHGQIFTTNKFDTFQRRLGKISNRLAFFLRYHAESLFNRVSSPVFNIDDRDLRREMIAKIHSSDRFFMNPKNPFFLRPLDVNSAEQPTYYIAVAQLK
jgi:2-polyprenyl-3-methyl-5-hydroxy-6-metoxy-1,4-benzoquinol methylase